MTRRIACLAFICLAALSMEAAMAQDKQEKEVDFPDLPTGAGKIDDNAPKTFKQTPSGLQYRILRAGRGDKPTRADKVKVNYQGWTPDGKVFDSSYRDGKPISFPLTRVIKGWTEGMQLVGEGGMIELVIPAELAYGERPPPSSGIAPGATLHFLVELIEVQ